MPPRDQRYPVRHIFQKFLSLPDLRFQAPFFAFSTLSRPRSPLDHPARLEYFDTIRTPSSVIAPSPSPHTGSCPAPPPLVVQLPSPSNTLSLELPAMFFAPSALSCPVVRTSAEVEPRRHHRSHSRFWSSHLGSGRPTASTPLVMSPLTGSGFGQVSPGAALVRLREASVSVDTPAFGASPRFWSA